jgi:hypothetical protein
MPPSRGIRHQQAHNETEDEYESFRSYLLTALEDPEVAAALYQAVHRQQVTAVKRSAGTRPLTIGQAADRKRKASGRGGRG